MALCIVATFLSKFSISWLRLPYLFRSLTTVLALQFYTFIWLFGQVHGSIISKLWGRIGAKVIDTGVGIFRNNLLNIRSTIYDFFVIE